MSDSLRDQLLKAGLGKKPKTETRAPAPKQAARPQRPAFKPVAKESEVDRLCADSRKGQSILGWTPKYSLEDGLAATVEWIRENSERYRTDIYVV